MHGSSFEQEHPKHRVGVFAIRRPRFRRHMINHPLSTQEVRCSVSGIDRQPYRLNVPSACHHERHVLPSSMPVDSKSRTRNRNGSSRFQPSRSHRASRKRDWRLPSNNPSNGRNDPRSVASVARLVRRKALFQLPYKTIPIGTTFPGGSISFNSASNWEESLLFATAIRCTKRIHSVPRSVTPRHTRHCTPSNHVIWSVDVISIFTSESPIAGDASRTSPRVLGTFPRRDELRRLPSADRTAPFLQRLPESW